MREIRKTMRPLCNWIFVATLLPAALCPASPTLAAAQEAPRGAAVTPVATQAAAPADQTPADRARTVLDKHCARCHQAGGSETSAASLLQNVLAFDDLVREA